MQHLETLGMLVGVEQPMSQAKLMCNELDMLKDLIHIRMG
ncbi:DNA repair exonuclease [Vibrio furnissii NCTC 11218]|nr:DNA repair exonuclease [Vibrio furnissii NCTC 11218]